VQQGIHAAKVLVLALTLTLLPPFAGGGGH
jgi:hypothetical protein